MEPLGLWAKIQQTKIAVTKIQSQNARIMHCTPGLTNYITSIVVKDPKKKGTP